MTVPIGRLSFGGVRGSTPTVDPATWRYGGNTPCLELIAPDGTQFILDCGTGLRMLGSRWAAPNGGKAPETHILVTHYHWDHIQGIPFFSPLYVENNEFHFYSFRSKFLVRDSLKQVFEAQMALPYFPVDMSAMSAKRKFKEVDGGDSFTVGENKIMARWLNHPQGCLGFRIETPAGRGASPAGHESGAPTHARDANGLAACSAIARESLRSDGKREGFRGRNRCARYFPAGRADFVETPAAAAIGAASHDGGAGRGWHSNDEAAGVRGAHRCGSRKGT